MSRSQTYLPTLRTSRRGDPVEEAEVVQEAEEMMVVKEEETGVLKAPHLVLREGALEEEVQMQLQQQAAKPSAPAAEP